MIYYFCLFFKKKKKKKKKKNKGYILFPLSTNQTFPFLSAAKLLGLFTFALKALILFPLNPHWPPGINPAITDKKLVEKLSFKIKQLSLSAINKLEEKTSKKMDSGLLKSKEVAT
jgi:hypothetical protein